MSFRQGISRPSAIEVSKREVKISPNTKLLIIGGPSGVGKTHLFHSLTRIDTFVRNSFERIIPFYSRPLRPDETDGKTYYFRKREALQKLGSRKDYFLFETRGNLMALDQADILKKLSQHSLIFEGPTTVAKKLKALTWPSEIEILDLFVSPLSANEINNLCTIIGPKEFKKAFVRSMQKIMFRRARQQNRFLKGHERQIIESESNEAYEELKAGKYFSYVLVNHDSEESSHWRDFPIPVGDAGKAIHSLRKLIRGDFSGLERWTPSYPTLRENSLKTTMEPLTKRLIS